MAKYEAKQNTCAQTVQFFGLFVPLMIDVDFSSILLRPKYIA